MTTLDRTYRGISYDSTNHERASRSYVEHIYRGKKYQAPLNHDAALNSETAVLHYRGSVYQLRRKEAAMGANN